MRDCNIYQNGTRTILSGDYIIKGHCFNMIELLIVYYCKNIQQRSCHLPLFAGCMQPCPYVVFRNTGISTKAQFQLGLRFEFQTHSRNFLTCDGLSVPDFIFG